MTSALRSLFACVFGAVAALSGCGVSTDASETSGASGNNQCTTDEDCEQGTCESFTCVARRSALENVALEITGPAATSAGEYRQIRYLHTIQLETSGNFDILLDYVAELVAQISPPSSDCAGDDLDSAGRLPVRVEAIQDPKVIGIGASNYVGVSDPNLDDNSVALRVPPGVVDLYVEPTGSAADSSTPTDCSRVPFLALGQKIEAGKVQFQQKLVVAQTIDVDIVTNQTGENASALDGYTVNLVDPLYGRRLSTQRLLAAPAITDGKAKHQVELRYQPIAGVGAGDLAGRENLRFVPPTGSVAPTFYVTRLAADLFGTNHLLINQIARVPRPVVVSGRVLSKSNRVPVAAQVTAVLRGGSDPLAGALAQFRVSAPTDPQGRFELNLVAGDFDVVATPLTEVNYASIVAAWSLSESTDESERILSLPEASALTGRISVGGAGSEGVAANVLAMPTSIGARSTFADGLVRQTVSSRRSAAGMVDTEGAFELSVDPGNYDVCVRPADDSGYPWFVRPNTVVGSGAVGLGAMQLTAPFAFTGQVTVPGLGNGGERVVLPGALIRAFALFDSNGRLVSNLADATGAVQIGEARAASTGQYQLLLPARLE
ncbi:MAG: hypothetical protein QM784_12610 [Polyangiaceae bacterium]